MKKIILIVSLIFNLVAGTSTIYAQSDQSQGQCKHENAECKINSSEKECCPGLICVPYNDQSGNGKCLNPSPTPDLGATPTPTPNSEATPTPTTSISEITPTPTAEPTHAPNPTATPTKKPSSNETDNNSSNSTSEEKKSEEDKSEGEVLGISTGGMVLGATTYANAGMAIDNLLLLSAFSSISISGYAWKKWLK